VEVNIFKLETFFYNGQLKH